MDTLLPPIEDPKTKTTAFSAFVSKRGSLDELWEPLSAWGAGRVWAPPPLPPVPRPAEARP